MRIDFKDRIIDGDRCIIIKNDYIDEDENIIR